MKNTALFALLLLATMSALVVSCGESEPLATNERRTNIRFWNMMPDANAEALDVVVDDGELTVTGIRFKQEQTNYSQVFSGPRNFKIFPVLNGRRNALPTIDTIADFSNRQNQFFTLMVIDSAKKNAPLLIRDNYNLRPDTLTGRFQIRVLHLSPNAPGVQIGVIRQQDTLLVRDTLLIRDTLAFMRNLDAAGITSQAGFRTFRVSRFTPDQTDTTIRLFVRAVGVGDIDLPEPVRIQEKSVYTIIARGIAGETGARALEFRVMKDR